MDSPVERFEQFELSAALTRRLDELGDETPSHIQSVCIPPLLAGRDLLAEAEAGSGRTLAFVLPLLQNLDPAARQPQVLVLTAADLTSLHVAEMFQRHARYLADFHVLPINQQGAAIQSRQIRRGAQVIVGTPRRIAHHIENFGLDIAGVTTAILDEADEMLREGFGDDIRIILEKAPAIRQKAIFAATMSKALERLAREILCRPLTVRGTEPVTVFRRPRLRHWLTDAPSKLNVLARLIEVEPEFDAALVFVRDTAGANDLAERLKSRGYAAAALDGAPTPESRAALAWRLEQGEIDLIVATDRAARDIRLHRITHVISHDMPRDTDSHAARIAHISRNGGRRTAVLLVTPPEMGMLRSLEHATGMAIPVLELPERIR